MDDQNIKTRRWINTLDKEYTRQMDHPYYGYMDTRGTDIEATRHLRGLSGLQETSNRNDLCPTINPC